MHENHPGTGWGYVISDTEPWVSGGARVCVPEDCLPLEPLPASCGLGVSASTLWICSGCHDGRPEAWWLINEDFLSPSLEARGPGSRLTADLVSGVGPSDNPSQMAISSLDPHIKGTLRSPHSWALIPLMRALFS